MIPPFKYLPLFFGLLLLSCNDASDKRETKNEKRQERIQAGKSGDDNSHLRDPEGGTKKKTQLIVKNRKDYAPSFLEELEKSIFKKIELIDSLLIIEERDTITFYDVPAFGESILYTGRKGELVIALTVTRKNYTTLTYHLEMVEFGKASYEEDGEAHVSSGFYFGSESEETPEGELYFVDEYFNQKADNCSIQIRISDEKHLCRLTKSCNGKLRDINRRDFPALMEKNRF